MENCLEKKAHGQLLFVALDYKCEILKLGKFLNFRLGSCIHSDSWPFRLPLTLLQVAFPTTDLLPYLWSQLSSQMHLTSSIPFVNKEIKWCQSERDGEIKRVPYKVHGSMTIMWRFCNLKFGSVSYLFHAPSRRLLTTAYCNLCFASFIWWCLSDDGIHCGCVYRVFVLPVWSGRLLLGGMARSCQGEHLCHVCIVLPNRVNPG